MRACYQPGRIPLLVVGAAWELTTGAFVESLTLLEFR